MSLTSPFLSAPPILLGHARQGWAQQLRQLRHVDRNPPRLILAEQLGR